MSTNNWLDTTASIALVIGMNCFYLGKISDHVTTLTVGLRHYIEEKRFDVIIQRLVVKEQLCKQAQVLTVNLQHTHTLQVTQQLPIY